MPGHALSRLGLAGVLRGAARQPVAPGLRSRRTASFVVSRGMTDAPDTRYATLRSERRHTMPQRFSDTHSVLMGYLLWIFGVFGAHRFYYGKPVTGTLWFLTLGLLLVGWIIDLFLIPGMARDADRRFVDGSKDYNVAWILLTFLGVLGIHRFYLGKWITGVIYLLTGGLFLVGYVYDYWTLNDQIDEINARDIHSADGRWRQRA
jgi:TM2 domain-containing membrane protein YozV